MSVPQHLSAYIRAYFSLFVNQCTKGICKYMRWGTVFSASFASSFAWGWCCWEKGLTVEVLSPICWETKRLMEWKWEPRGTNDRVRQGSENKQLGKGNERELHVSDPCNMKIWKLHSCIFAYQVHLLPQLGFDQVGTPHILTETCKCGPLKWQAWVQALVKVSIRATRVSSSEKPKPIQSLTILSDLFGKRIKWKETFSLRNKHISITLSLWTYYSTEKTCWHKQKPHSARLTNPTFSQFITGF